MIYHSKKYGSLFSIIDEISLWRSVLGYTPVIGNSQTNTLREDRNPGSVVFYHKNGKLLMKDFADPTFSGIDAINAYAIKHNITNKEAIKTLLQNKLYEYKAPIPQKKAESKITSIKVETIKFTPAHIEFLKSHGISTIRDNIIHAVGKSYINGFPMYFRGLQFAYYFKESNHIKLYNPQEDKTRKWFSNTDARDIYGLDTLIGKSNLLITKSGKDYLLLKDIAATFEIDYDVIAPNNESVFFPEDIKEFLDSRYKKIVLIYDNDNPGIKNMKHKSEKYGWDYYILKSEHKDPTDMAKNSQLPSLISQLCTVFS